MTKPSRQRLLRLPQVEARTGLSRGAIYRLLIATPPRFPRPIKLGRTSAWVEQEIAEWVIQQIAARDSTPDTQREGC